MGRIVRGDEVHLGRLFLYFGQQTSGADVPFATCVFLHTTTLIMPCDRAFW